MYDMAEIREEQTREIVYKKLFAMTEGERESFAYKWLENYDDRYEPLDCITEELAICEIAEILDIEQEVSRGISELNNIASAEDSLRNSFSNQL